MRILGIDPGSRLTGFGILELDGTQARYITSGCIRTGSGRLPQRLKAIVEGVAELIDTHQPDEMAIEKVFMNRNADSALKLGQARGAAISAIVVRDLPVHEYSANEIKQAIVGRGHADKTQIQFMVKNLLNLPALPQADAADALACALCHSYTRQTLVKMHRGRRTARVEGT